MNDTLYDGVCSIWVTKNHANIPKFKIKKKKCRAIKLARTGNICHNEKIVPV